MEVVAGLVAVALAVALAVLLVREHLGARAAGRRSDAMVAALRSELADAEEHVEQARDGLRVAERAATEASERASVAEDVATSLWLLEVERAERAWRESVVPLEDADAARSTGAQLEVAVRWELDRLREEAGVPTAVRGTLGAALPAATALVALRATQEVLAAVTRCCDEVDVELADNPQDGLTIVVTGGGQVAPFELPAGVAGAVATRCGTLVERAGEEGSVVVELRMS
ncbi:MAG TPA: hypothetical protein VMN58_06045 [Acidimicrobiales bacterium]|nr:hypothetical protein [Acidimicrobiales bacterium]